MISKEESRKHYIFSTEHVLDDENKMLKEYIEQIEKDCKFYKEWYEFYKLENNKVQVELRDYFKETLNKETLVRVKELISECIEKDKKLQQLETKEQRVIDKLEELKKEYKKALETNSVQVLILKCQIEILQELLEK